MTAILQAAITWHVITLICIFNKQVVMWSVYWITNLQTPTAATKCALIIGHRAQKPGNDSAMLLSMFTSLMFCQHQFTRLQTWRGFCYRHKAPS